MGHDSWTQTYSDPELYDWLLLQSPGAYSGARVDDAAWSLVGCQEVKPPKRSAHILCNRYPGVASPRALLVHGGEGEGGIILNDLWWLDLDELAAGRQSWQCVETEGSNARSNHAAILDEDCLYVFGGVRAKREALANLEILDLETKTWHTPVVSGVPPPPRWNPTLVLYKVFIVTTPLSFF